MAFRGSRPTELSSRRMSATSKGILESNYLVRCEQMASASRQAVRSLWTTSNMVSQITRAAQYAWSSAKLRTRSCTRIGECSPCNPR